MDIRSYFIEMIYLEIYMLINYYPSKIILSFRQY